MNREFRRPLRVTRKIQQRPLQRANSGKTCDHRLSRFTRAVQPEPVAILVRQAEAAGFGAVMTSDHFAPWSERQGNSGNNWAWLGEAMASTSLPFGSLAIPGGPRYHPAVLAQIIATLSEMFPDRLRWIAAGSGEALNESVVGRGWPEKNAEVASGAIEESEHFIPLVTCSDNLLDLISDGLSCGFDEIHIHSVSRGQQGFIDFMGYDVLPTLSVDRDKATEFVR